MRVKILNRYISEEIIPTFLVSILVFTFIMLLARMMVLTNLVISKGVELSMVVEMVLIAMPRILSMTLPIAALLAVLMAFLRLSADSELTVLRASGLSLYQLLPPVLVFGLITALLTGILSIWVVPETNWKFRNRMLDLAKARADLAISEQMFIHSFPGIVIYVGHLNTTNNIMENIIIYDQRSKDEQSVIEAKEGRLGLDKGGMVLLFHLADGVIDRIYPGKVSADSTFFKNYELKISPGDEFDDSQEDNALGFSRGRSELPTSQLKAVAASLDPQTKRKMQLTLYMEWHRRLAMPATALLMSVIGLSLGSSFRVRGRNFGLLTAIIVLVLYYTINNIGWSLSEEAVLPPVVGVWLVNIVLAVFSFLSLKRINRGVPIDPIEQLKRTVNTFKRRARIARSRSKK